MYSKLFHVWLVALLLSSILPFHVYEHQAYAADAARKTLNVNKTLAAPVIDGKLEESFWAVDQTLQVQTGNGPFKDTKFGMLWDNKYLFIGVKAADDTPIYNAPGNWFEQDSINVFVDPTLHRSAPFAADDMQMGLVYQPETTTPEFHFGAALSNHSGKDEKKILRAINKTAEGWTLEMAVPWDMLNFDPLLKKQLGLEITAGDRYGTDSTQNRSSAWSAYNESTFWNNTAGYGVITLVDDHPIPGSVNTILLQENFDGIPAGQIPYGWKTDASAGSNSFTVVKDTYGNGRISVDVNGTNKQSRIFAPVQWDNYIIEADLRFESVLNSARWASLIFRAPSSALLPYNQMAVRQNGTYEIAYRKTDGSWSVPVTGTWGKTLALNSYYSMKVRVFDNNVKEYIKAKSDTNYSLLTDKSLTAELLERGKIGFQADQSKISFDNLKVTRITADRLNAAIPTTAEALTGPISVTGSVYYSDGITDVAAFDRVKFYSSDESIVKIINNKLYPLKQGKANVKAVYYNAEVSQEVTVTPSLTGAKVVSIKHNEGYALAVSGQPLDLNSLSFQTELNDFSSQTLPGGQLSWTSGSGAVVFENGTFKVQQKGVYPVTGQKDGAAVSILFIVKNPGDAEYVLYEENFDAIPEGTLPQGWTRKQGTTASAATVKSGAFEMNASAAPDNPSRVLLPDYLGLFGNYKIEADVTHLTVNNNARWNAIMYRIQNNDYPYYQMAVRKDATAVNGVEFSERTPANGWNVIDTGSFTEVIDAGRLYRYTVKAYGTRVQESIDNKPIIDTDQAAAYTKGRIGFQADGSAMKLDNIRVTLQQEPLPPVSNGHFVQVTEPETKISMAASIATELKSSQELVDLTGPTLPATVVLHIGEGLKVMEPSRMKEMGSLDSVLSAIGTRMIPAFYVKDEQTVDELVEYLKNKGIEDADVISDNGELVKRARTAYPIIRGIVDFSTRGSLTKEDMLDVRRKTTISLAKIALLPQNAASPENVSYLQKRTIVVWAKEAAAQREKSVTLHQLITSGVDGILTDSPNTAFTALKVYSNNTTLIRKPYVIGHRGVPSKAPENTIESNELGLDYGADYIENDIYLSKDGHLVILHDGALERTTNGTGFIEDYTLAQLKALNANKPFPVGFPDVKIPTLEEQIDLARKKGKMVMSEMKTDNPAAVDAYVKLIKDKNAEDVMDTMSFSGNQLKRLAELMPEMPLGLLTSGLASESNVNSSLRKTLKQVQSLNVTLNTSFSGLGKNFMEASKHRGIIISPWTFNDKKNFIQFFLYGAWGLTTDYAFWAADWAIAIKPEKANQQMMNGGSLTLSAEIETYNGTKTAITPEIVMLDGQDLIEVNGNKATAKKPGTATILLRYTASIDEANKYDIYSQPISIEVKPVPRDHRPSGGSSNGSNLNPSVGSQDGQPGNAVINVVNNDRVEVDVLRGAFQSASKVEVNHAGEKLLLPAEGLVDAVLKPGALLVITSENVTYQLPLSVLKLEELQRQLGTILNDLWISITIKKLIGSEAAAVRDAVAKSGGTQIADTVEYDVQAVSNNGKSARLTFGSTYVSRSLVLNKAVDSLRATGVMYMPETKTLRFVPTIFEAKDGKTTATMQRNGNSVYSVVENNKSFVDMTNHWAKADVELLANKLVIDGVSDNRFDGERNITRAEFAVLLARALSLSTSSGAKNEFSDLASTAWYAGDVAAATEAGMINGYEDGTFRPNREITREEQAVMIIRALSYVNMDVKVSQAQQDEILGRYKDVDKIVWAKAEVAAAVNTGLINGMTTEALMMDSYSTRAQSAVTLKRLLYKVNFIN
ncbi:DUF1080 domain-containing protein [Paenibacillus sp. LMG 31456]|uniref:DUF1080 domain-containing protein n=1 Tax=Paenibacillus foliorum TaxID=2654974 RepID=A0A972K0H0_9BACL|nr:glycerophosphodiester phosphodiesterase family protein [Paenibacillus foliorum]NOU94656.1 DUF1080 domain-containing protein [Paenibacillus foliorum]